MNILNFYVKLYGSLYNRKGIHYRVLSPFRYVVRKLANWQIPSYLLKYPQKPQGKRIENLIVSFTSFPTRIDKVWIVVECIKRQTFLPEKTILWLSKDQFPTVESIPQSLWCRTDELFEIRMVNGDIKSHKKYYYALNAYPNKKILLIDDDIFYPTYMIEEIIGAHRLYPNSIICRYGFLKKYTTGGTLKPYNGWTHLASPIESNDLFFGSGGGTLIQKSLLYEDCTKKDIFLKLTPNADDVWLNAMTYLAGSNIIKISKGMILPILQNSSEMLSTKNVGYQQNDVQINSVSEYYKETIGIDPFTKI